MHSMIDPQDQLAIFALISEYSWTYDGEDLEGFAALFCQDGVLDTPAGGGTGAGEILAWARARWAEIRAQGKLPRHFQTNTRLRATGPDHVHGTTQLLLVWCCAETGAPEIKFAASYEDEFERTPDGWRIRRRSIGLGPSRRASS